MNDLIALEVTTEQRALIKKTIAPDANDAELELFFYDNRRKGVHPLDRLIHFTKRRGRYVPITSIHFMRSKADEGGRAGQDKPVYAGIEQMPDYECAVTVYKLVGIEKVPYIGVAKWKEFYPGGGDEGFMWRKMPSHMLAKCAEANALRLGFPRELANLHISEEVHVIDDLQPDNPAPAEITPPKNLKERLMEQLVTQPSPYSEPIEAVKPDDGVQPVSRPDSPQPTHDDPAPDPDVFREASAMVDWEVIIKEVDDVMLQETWDAIVKDGRLTGPQRAKLYKKVEARKKARTP